jgi:hypothetical protein
MFECRWQRRFDLNFRTAPETVLCSLGRKTLVALIFGTAIATGQAAPLDDLQALAQLPRVDVAQLKAGEVLSQRGPLGDFSRGIYIESCYYIHAPIEKVGNGLLHWNPVQHPQQDVRIYQEYKLSAARGAFEKLQLNRAIREDGWLLTQTAHALETGQPGDLHLTNEELTLLRQKSISPSQAWQEVLRRRSEALAQGGLGAVPAYGSDKSISPRSEFRGLLSLAPQAARHFRPLTEAQPLVAGGKPPGEAVAYWEATKVRDHTTLQLGLFAARKSPDSWQLVDCVYYPSDTYFMALDLFQLWPLDGGTLVWQVGFVSAPFRSYLGGVDRYVAGKQMTQETLNTIKAFRADLEQRH